MHSLKRIYHSRWSPWSWLRSRSWSRLRRHSSQSQSRLQWQLLKSFLLRLRPHPQNTKSSQNLLQSRECPKLLFHPIDMIPSSKNWIHHILWLKVRNGLFTSLCFRLIIFQFASLSDPLSFLNNKQDATQITAAPTILTIHLIKILYSHFIYSFVSKPHSLYDKYSCHPWSQLYYPECYISYFFLAFFFSLFSSWIACKSAFHCFNKSFSRRIEFVPLGLKCELNN